MSQNKRLKLTYNFESMRTDWLLMEKERVERELQEATCSAIQSDLETSKMFIESELTARRDDGGLSGREDNSVQEILNEGYW